MRERKYADKVQLSDKRRAEIRGRAARYAATDVILRNIANRKHLTKEEYWESNDGLTVSSRQIRTAWGTIEHVAISRMNGNTRDIPWAVKQQIKDELFGSRRIAIEVFPSQKNLVDTCDVYHLWVLPKDFTLPFGIHPVKDPQGTPVERGYDFSVEDSIAWTESEERKQLMAQSEDPLATLITTLLRQDDDE